METLTFYHSAIKMILKVFNDFQQQQQQRQQQYFLLKVHLYLSIPFQQEFFIFWFIFEELILFWSTNVSPLNCIAIHKLDVESHH